MTSDLEPFEKLHETIWNWLPEILNRFVCRISNAKNEGKNNQLRTMNQQGFCYSLPTLQARMKMKEEREALIKWRKYQERYEHKLKWDENQPAS
ncbi:transposase [Lederbergia sp. NSJ-179]|uniref:transposase n=1 Tax=Lederbergia sp. NSJ-179 TaxID=2931402 RepID=UPI001FD272F6|nr:transposase [Lederbergia sp. NSJ-179]MCJ7843536.1 transposase [Lederbergia sp. NSJ-179]